MGLNIFLKTCQGSLDILERQVNIVNVGVAYPIIVFPKIFMQYILSFFNKIHIVMKEVQLK